MNNHRSALSPWLLLAALLWSAASGAAETSAFLRLVDGEGGSPVALEVALAHFRRADGARVDLVGAVHIGDQAYYRTLDQRLAGYDAVLYELVGDPDAAVEPPPDAALSLLGLFQGGVSEGLGLAFQLDHIRYDRTNMVHADLTTEEFSDSMRERGESMFQLVLRAWALGGTAAGRAAAARQQADLVKVLFADDRRLALKRALARQLADARFMRMVLSGPEGSTLIEVRNQRALGELERLLALGARSLAIFYGAGHMADLSERLQAEYGFQLEAVEWVEAWDLRER